MGDTSWQRIRTLLEQALDRPDAERDAFLDAACDGDADLRAALDELLAADSGDRFLEPPDTDQALGRALGDELPTDARVGAFRLVRRLGSGGMGTVYLAEQDTPRRQVALKMLSLAVSSPAALRRFQDEAEILGRLRHPGVAQVYEAGLHRAAGLEVPYFAMEYVEDALPLDAFCEGHDLPPEARLRLFRRVCDAVHHGHEKGVVHRDLKPGNILVDRDGQPKVIDFGIARIEAEAEAEDETFRERATRTGQILGTLQYMSPEQLLGQPDAIDTRTDVYALGVVLYELLCGRLPYELPAAPLGEAARIVRERPARRPSTVARLLHGDVDAIVLKALEKDPERRYRSAAALSDDIERFLDRRPVEARPPSALYQVRTFARRHRTVVAALAVIFVALAAATIVSVRFAMDEARAAGEARQARQDALDAQGRAEAAAARASAAEERASAERDKALAARDAESDARDRAEQLLRSSLDVSFDFLLTFYERVSALEGSTELSAELLRKVVDHLEFLEQRAAGDEDVLWLLAQTHLSLASVLGSTFRRNLGDREGAERSLQRVFEIAEELYARDPDRPRHRTLMGSAWLRRGNSLALAGRREEGLEATQKGIELYTLAAAAEPENDRILLNLTGNLSSLAAALAHLDRDAEAEAVAREQLALWKRLEARDPEDPEYRQGRAAALGFLADMASGAGRHAEAAGLRESESGLLEALSAADPTNVEYRSALGRSYEWRSQYAMHAGDDGRAHELAQRALAIFEELAASDPGDSRATRQLSYSVFNQGEVWRMRAVTWEVDAAERADLWDAAARHYTRSRDLLLALRDSGRLPPDELHKPEEIQGFLETALDGAARARGEVQP